MGGCSSKDPKDYVAHENQRGPVPSGAADGSRHRQDNQHEGGGSRRGRPAVDAPERADRSNRRPNNNTVDFQEFKDKEKNVVETMLESNKGLRMAEINFNDLKLQKIIGAGAFGEVIKGTYCGTPVVVKRMLRNKITEDNLRMFGDEIQLMMNLRHPNIVQFIGASWNSYSNICFVTEFLERGDLFAVLRNPENKMTWAKPILRMTIDTSRGMAYLHSMKPPIIHRDLKSMNILVSSTWGAKVSDFGLSREKSVDETMSVTGTPLWLPPEMIRGERYTEKADVYSFGIAVLAELDTRKIPYHDIKAKGARNKKVSGSTLMHMVAYENLRPSLSKNCMDSVRDLYKRCTSDDQSVRPTFEEIVQFLENDVRKETLVRANEEMNVIEEDQNGSDVSPEELGVHHATRYVD
ncbi:hypothetical protein PHYSODRAFT_556648 [Phytophthora sojae]|uniref:Protein kinase domain-containing protein n=1 Tax=Phytophthora sojae (strain P6497) TaxID=1094619 RepID=G4Z123_PHYSP|nr:hypothetical protein PHYSODRAFT_556648 [Phytophthora sojae]EGZ24024.1 hypothetical protein PHYSODRAFT_556648 [Phytophthora sojae]|eukprot:XP_009519312.1 hypothetical protein PHYSODRAFT_556648 [Phytophthora sojae]